MIGNKRSLTEKADMVCKLIQLFGIGCIIFDEIQLIIISDVKMLIYNMDELCNNLEQINDLTKDDVQKKLARSSDEVIYKFLQK